MLEGSAINRDLAVPLYHQIYLQLRDEITSGQRPFGSLVPTEQEVAESLGVSRITARRALDELAQHKLVERRRRIGTRVIFQSPTKPLEANIDQAMESLAVFGRNTKVQVLEIAEEPARSPVTDNLKIPLGEPVLRSVRVRWLDDEPLGHIVSYTPARLTLPIDRKTLLQTQMLDLLEQAGIKIGAATRTISAASANAAMAQALEIESRSPLLRISSTLSDTAGQPVLMILAHYRSDRYQIRLDLHPTELREHI
jgi:GntR family transcriptional regulator